MVATAFYPYDNDAMGARASARRAPKAHVANAEPTCMAELLLMAGPAQAPEWLWYSWHQLPKRLGASCRSRSPLLSCDAQPFRAGSRREGLQADGAGDQVAGGGDEDDHLALLGVLNSSTACFWLKQVSHDKGDGGNGRWHQLPSHGSTFYEFTGTKLQEFPLACDCTRFGLGREMDGLAQRLAAVTPRRSRPLACRRGSGWSRCATSGTRSGRG